MQKVTSKIEKPLNVTILTDIVGNSENLFIYAPGSSSNVYDSFGSFLSLSLPQHQISLMRFHFPYQEQQKRSPDNRSLLISTWREVLDWSKKYHLNTIIGGRSLGGKIASYIVAEKDDVQGLAFFAYPFHPPGRQSQANNSHLSYVKKPMFFCSGTRDAFADSNVVRDTLSLIPRSTFTSLTEADHGFAPRKSAAETQEEIWSNATHAFINWIKTMR